MKKNINDHNFNKLFKRRNCCTKKMSRKWDNELREFCWKKVTPIKSRLSPSKLKVALIWCRAKILWKAYILLCDKV